MSSEVMNYINNVNDMLTISLIVVCKDEQGGCKVERIRNYDKCRYSCYNTAYRKSIFLKVVDYISDTEYTIDFVELIARSTNLAYKDTSINALAYTEDKRFIKDITAKTIADGDISEEAWSGAV